MPKPEKCENCGALENPPGSTFKTLLAFGEDDVILCEPCWKSAYWHKHGGGSKRECGIDTCRVCYEEEE